MTGKRRLLVYGMVILLILGFSILIYGINNQRVLSEDYGSLAGLESAADAAPHDYIDPPDFLLEELNSVQDENGSWQSDLNTTAISGYTNSFYDDHSTENASGGSEKTLRAQESINWTSQNYYYGAPAETQAFILMNDVVELPSTPSMDYELGDFQTTVEYELLANQKPNGSWNDDISDTALATYAFAQVYGPDNESVEKGITWLKDMEVDNEWGSIQEGAKAILALDATNNDINYELEELILKQEQNGSFGTVEDTAWALMAISVDLDLDNIEYADKAIIWLRTQEMDDERDLALAALGEQYYNSAVIESNILGTGLGPPSWIYPALITIFASLILAIVLYARLSSDNVMDGVRKEIFDYISENPGEHLAGITRKFGLSSSNARHHLLVLEWGDKIVSHKTSKHKHYYSNQNGYRKFTNGFEYKDIMSTLKNQTSREMVKLLMDNEGSNQKSIALALNIHPSTVNWHAKRLKNANIITKTRMGKDIVYSLNKDLELIKVIAVIEGASS